MQLEYGMVCISFLWLHYIFVGVIALGRVCDSPRKCDYVFLWEQHVIQSGEEAVSVLQAKL